MKNFAKVLILGALSISALAGCNKEKQPVNTSSNEQPSAISSILESSSAATSNSSSNTSNSQASSSSSKSSSSSSSSLAPTLTGIVLETTNVLKEYYVGDALNLMNLFVDAKYSDNSKVRLTAADYTTNPANGTVLTEAGEVTVVVTYQQFQESFVVNVNQTWTTEQAQLMSDNLYGIVLPYTGFDSSEVTYDAQTLTLTINCGAFTADSIADYVLALINDGFTLYGSNQAQTQFGLRKAVEANVGKRYVSVAVVAEGDVLMIYAGDPYLYVFPAGLAAAYASQIIGSDYVAPNLDGAEFYEYSTNPAAIFCYMNSTTEDAGYSAILQTAGWYIQAEKDSYGYIVAVAPDYSYQVSYIYQKQAGRLAIYFEYVGKWQPDFFTKTFQKNNAEAFDIPEYETAQGAYLFFEGSGVMYVGVVGTTTAETDAYAAKLRTAGWEVTELNGVYSAKKLIEEKGYTNVRFSFNSNNGQTVIIINIELDPLPTVEWPAEQIAARLYSKWTDTVPAFEGKAISYAVRHDSNYNYLKIEVEPGTENACIEAYIQTLKNAGYALQEGMSTIYVSEHNQIIVSLYTSEAHNNKGYFEVMFYDVVVTDFWPGERVAMYLNDLEVTDEIPAFEIETEETIKYSWEPDDDGLWIGVTSLAEESELDTDAVVGDYYSVLEQNNYTKVFEDEDGMVYYVSKNFQVVVSAYYDDSYECFYVFANTVEALTGDNWPMYHVMYFLNSHNYTDLLPAYEGDFESISTTLTRSSLRIDITLETTDAEEIKAAADEYADLLVASGFVFAIEYDNGRCRIYTSSNGSYEVSIMYQPDGFTVQLDENANDYIYTDEFPYAQLYAAHPELVDALPVVEDENAKFQTQIQGNYVEIYVTYEDTTLILPAMSAYTAALQEAGYQAVDGTQYGYETVYMSKDGTYYVAVTDWLEEEVPGFDIEIYYID